MYSKGFVYTGGIGIPDWQGESFLLWAWFPLRKLIHQFAFFSLCCSNSLSLFVLSDDFFCCFFEDSIREVAMKSGVVIVRFEFLLDESPFSVVPLADFIPSKFLDVTRALFFAIALGFSATLAQESKDRLGVKGERDESMAWGEVC